MGNRIKWIDTASDKVDRYWIDPGQMKIVYGLKTALGESFKLYA